MKFRIVLILLAAISLQARSVHYRLSMPEPHTHLLHVEMTLENTRGTEIIAMPVWTPGSYLVREFARQVQDLEITDGQGNVLKHWKADKNHWKIRSGRNRTVIVRYKVYAFEKSVRTSYLDADHALINGASVFMYWQENTELEHVVEVELPDSWTEISTSLEPFSKTGNRRFTARNYDELVDSPMQLGNHKRLNFMVAGKPHEIAIYGVGNFNDSTLTTDVSRIVVEQSKIFGDLPYDHYLFIIHAQSGRGGLEHKNSSVNFVDRWAFEDSSRYHSVLSLLSHEFFHTWNVKRIFPAGLDRFDYDRENYTAELWIAEGLTSYYDEHVLLRNGLSGREDYLKVIANEINTLENRPGRWHQSAAESSFDAWIKYYRSDEHSSNVTISYYNKGHLLGLLLDLEIRAATQGQASMDDVFRKLYKEFALTERGFTNADFQRICEAVSGRDFDEWFNRYVHGLDPLPYNSTFALAGLKLDTTRVQESYLGAQLRKSDGLIKVTRVVADSPAWFAGISVGDEIVALDGFRVQAAVPKYLQERQPGDMVSVTLSRNGLLRELAVTLGTQPDQISDIVPLDTLTAEQKSLQSNWLGETLD